MSKFLESIDHHCNGLENVSAGICPDCAVCQSDFGMSAAALTEAVEQGNLIDEGGVSKQGCDTCGSSPQQILYSAHATSPDGQLVHLTICDVCVLYFSNGTVPKYWEE